MRIYTPPFTVTLDILQKTQEIQRVLGGLEINIGKTSLIKHELQDDLQAIDPLNKADLLRAHKLLVKGSAAGQYRKNDTPISAEHLVPQADRIPHLMDDLFIFSLSNQVSWLLKSCTFYYELLFIHPFEDGNKQISMLWQHLLLAKEHPIFLNIHIESYFKKSHQEYLNALSQSDTLGHSTPYIEFFLDVILLGLKDFAFKAPCVKEPQQVSKDALSRLHLAKRSLQYNWFSRAHYRAIHKNLSAPTTSRDLNFGLKQGILSKKGEKNQTMYLYLK